MKQLATGLAGVMLLISTACTNGSGSGFTPRGFTPRLLGVQLEAKSPVRHETTKNVDVNAFLRSSLAVDTNDCEGDTEHTCLLGELGKRDAQTKLEIRNSLTAQLLDASNVNCRSYLWSLRGTQVGTRLASDIFTGGFSLAATVNQHLPTAQLLSGLGAFSSATGASVDRSVFAQAGVEIIGDQIIEMRKVSRQHIERKMGEDYDTYPLGLALADISDYHQECSVMRGLTRMQSSLAQREAQIAVSRLTALRISEAGGDGKAVAAAIGGVADAYSTFIDRTSEVDSREAEAGILSRTPIADRRRSDVVAAANAALTPPVADTADSAAVRFRNIGQFREKCEEARNRPDFYGRPYCIASVIPEAFNAAAFETINGQIVQWINHVVVTRANTVRQLKSIQDYGGGPENVCQIVETNIALSKVDWLEDPVLAAMRNAVCGEAGEGMRGPLAAGVALAVGSAVIADELRHVR